MCSSDLTVRNFGDIHSRTAKTSIFHSGTVLKVLAIARKVWLCSSPQLHTPSLWGKFGANPTLTRNRNSARFLPAVESDYLQEGEPKTPVVVCGAASIEGEISPSLYTALWTLSRKDPSVRKIFIEKNLHAICNHSCCFKRYLLRIPFQFF